MRMRGLAVVTGLVCCAAGCAPPRAAQPTPVAREKPAKPPPRTVAAKPAPKPAAKPAARPAAKPAPRPAAKPSRPAAKGAPVKPAVPPVRVDSVQLERELLRERSHAPLTYVLSRRSGNTAIADRAAAAVVYEAQRLRLSPSLVAGVLLVENTPMDSTARSVAGAIGLMQVMPVHEGGLGCPSAELLEVESNICHGTRLLHMYLRRNRTLQAALRRYNGCVGKRVTRTCLRYPARVLRTASRVRREMLTAPVDTVPAPAPEPPPYYLRRVSTDSEESATVRIEVWPMLALLALPTDAADSPAGD